MYKTSMEPSDHLVYYLLTYTCYLLVNIDGLQQPAQSNYRNFEREVRIRIRELLIYLQGINYLKKNSIVNKFIL